MTKYSDFFATLYDEKGPVGELGRGTHYSVLRAVLWEAEPCFHDFAVVWDEDHDIRIIWVIEQLYARRLLAPVLVVGERKGGVSVITSAEQTPSYRRQVEEVTTSVPSDSFSSDVEAIAAGTASIVNADDARVRAYLAGICALWSLGSKPLRFSTEPYRLPPT